MYTYEGQKIIGSSSKPDKEVYLSLFDFRRPDSFTKDQMRAIMRIHEKYAALHSKYLSTVFLTNVEVELVSVDQLTYGECMMSIANPSALFMFGMAPLPGMAIMEIHPGLYSRCIQSPDHDTGEIKRVERPFTCIEQHVMRGIVGHCLADLAASWESIVKIQPDIKRYESNPQFVDLELPHQTVVLVCCLEIRINNAGYLTGFYYPHTVLRPLMNKLSISQRPDLMPATDTARFGSAADRLKSDVTIGFKADTLSLQQLGSLTRDSLIRIPGYEQGTAMICSDDRILVRLQHSQSSPIEFTVDEHVLAPEKDTGKKEENELSRAINKSTDAIVAASETFSRTIVQAIHSLDARLDTIAGKLQTGTGAESHSAGNALHDAAPGAVIDRLLGNVDPDVLAAFLMQEHPQTTALLLSLANQKKAGALLALLPAKMRTDIACRIAALDKVPHEIICWMEDALHEQLSTVQDAAFISGTGGVRKLNQVLDAMPPEIRAEVARGIAKKAPELRSGSQKKAGKPGTSLALNKKRVRK
jgi:flagellar motor switch protein FliM